MNCKVNIDTKDFMKMNYKILFVLPLLAIFNSCATMSQVFIKNEVTTNKEALEKKESDNRVRIFGHIIAAAFLFAGMLSAQKIDINAMPKPGPTPAINIAQPKTFQLSNGLTVMVVENNKLPRVNTMLSIDVPPYFEGNVTGVSQIMAKQFKNGTASIGKGEFNKRIDFLGANVNFSSKGATSNSLSKYFPEVLGLMADAIVNPRFSAKEIQNFKEGTSQVFIKNEVTTNKEALEKKESDNRVRIFGYIYEYPNDKPGDCCLHLLPPKPSK
ncbi:hypothetical protein SRABI04_01826 [Chryseobacterium sp. Bi04]|nr:hypothetical protein SRABI04_01826 [Chryseobacterium sp. Bi04]